MFFVSFGPFFPTTSEYIGRSLISRWIFSLKRSASSAWSATFNWFRLSVTPTAGLATTS